MKGYGLVAIEGMIGVAGFGLSLACVLQGFRDSSACCGFNNLDGNLFIGTIAKDDC